MILESRSRGCDTQRLTTRTTAIRQRDGKAFVCVRHCSKFLMCLSSYRGHLNNQSRDGGPSYEYYVHFTDELQRGNVLFTASKGRAERRGQASQGPSVIVLGSLLVMTSPGKKQCRQKPRNTQPARSWVGEWADDPLAWDHGKCCFAKSVTARA